MVAPWFSTKMCNRLDELRNHGAELKTFATTGRADGDPCCPRRGAAHNGVRVAREPGFSVNLFVTLNITTARNMLVHKYGTYE